MTMTIVYTMLAFAIGAFCGMVVELLVDDSLIRKYEEENQALRNKLIEASEVDHVEIINRVEVAEPANNEKLDFSQDW